MAKTTTTKAAPKTTAAKSAAPKSDAAPKRAAAKKPGPKKGTPRAPSANNALSKPLVPSAALAAVVGAAAIARSDVVSKVWAYIKEKNLQNPSNKREIMADEKLEPVFGQKSCSMFEMNRHLSRHLSDGTAS